MPTSPVLPKLVGQRVKRREDPRLIQGRGTYVASHNRDRMLFYFFHIVDDEGTKRYPEVELLSFAKAEPAAQAALRRRRQREKRQA